MKNRRMRVAFITQTAYQNFQTEMLSGVSRAAEEHDADIVRFSLSVNIDYFPDEKLLNKLLENICSIIERIDIDGLLLLSWIAPPEIVTKYLAGKTGIPIVVLGKNHQTYPSVYHEGSRFVRELVRHLNEDHKRSRIAYVEPTNSDERLDAYIDEMKNRGIYDSRYEITNTRIGYKPYFGFHERADRVVNYIYDEQKLSPDAMMVMHSNDAVGIIDRLKARGLKVPEDVAVTSWEESDLCRFNDPPVTTVYFPFREMGYIGCDKLAGIIKGESPPKKTEAPSRIIKRASCGCGLFPGSRVPLPKQIHSQGKILALLENNLAILDAETMLDTFTQSFRKKDRTLFSGWLKQSISGISVSTEHIKQTQQDIMFLKRIVDGPASDLFPDLRKVCDIWVHAFLVLSGGLEKILSKKERYRLQYASKAERISLYLSTMFNLDRIKTILSRYLPKIGINKCAIYELSGQRAVKPEYSFVYKYIDGIELEDNGEIFGNRLFSEEHRSVYNVHLLEVNLEIIGCVFFDYALKDDRIYLTLATQLASAISGTRTLEILKDSLSEKEMLMKELQHRVKNNLTTIISLLNIQSDKIQDASTKLVFREASNKIRSMSLIYDQLYKPSSNLKDVQLDDYLLSLTEQLADYYNLNTNRVTVSSELDPVSIDMKRCIYIGLLTNEIITNCYKYAFPEKDGIIFIRLKRKSDTITLEFTDNGIGIDDNYKPDNHHQYGLELVGINVRQLKGTLEIGNAKSGGTRVAITFPG